MESRWEEPSRLATRALLNPEAKPNTQFRGHLLNRNEEPVVCDKPSVVKLGVGREPYIIFFMKLVYEFLWSNTCSFHVSDQSSCLRRRKRMGVVRGIEALHVRAPEHERYLTIVLIRLDFQNGVLALCQFARKSTQLLRPA